MKLKDMDARHRRAYTNIRHAANWILGGLENVLEDFPEDSEEYRSAKESLADHDHLVEEIFYAATHNIYSDCGEFFDPGVERSLKDIRFCGNDWLRATVDSVLSKEGY